MLKDKATSKTEKENPIPASVSKNGLLEVNANNGVIDETSGTLVDSNSFYKK
ncbi:hypothetical protein [Acinetobacter sp. SFB]|uniref:hypothetical protein n=1 Tax=Acinetobacter sp. SFB TaxID=1805634 RepID=UPI000AECC0BF|nr:hypothetical protein [Acinetobacter sp. SFB]